jgi:hypothetical protein
MSAATIGLAYLLNDRLDPLVVIWAAAAGVLGILGVMGAYAGLLLLPIGSAILMLAVARARVMPASIAGIHALAAVGWLVTAWTSLAGRPEGWTIVLAALYGVSWILIGAWVLRGLPNPQPQPLSSEA